MSDDHVYLVYGKTGWLGGMILDMLQQEGATVHGANARMQDREAVAAELDAVQPTRVLCAAGLTGRPNVDWCESHKQEVIRTNVVGTLNLADLTAERGIHCTMYQTGCIFEYDEAHPIGGPGFTEEDEPNFSASYYSLTKGMVEKMLRAYDNVMVLRVRMPISDDLHPRSFITKISKYEFVVNVPNSMTILSELMPVSVDMAKRSLTGVYNFCNPGAISHNECLDLYTQYIDPEFTYQNFSLEEQAKILAAGRSNNTLDHTKLVEANPGAEINEIHRAMELCFQRMAAAMEAAGTLPAQVRAREASS